ncbi:hypothetical protein OCGS_2190 [Oceaniovalibus guishaninsula JLT2003]|uniref:Toxin n=1 Tax=Oceaniovalibus guishaninsula JLT2003 TaxID=1231392 RepID=K2I4C0_9RHOB|nr:type II toxin-antitoxin system RelE/ParE family toxin [Oceaniovalibus guishaninsula]EKE43705.1 hypothetical protein OCGS_2190 [Oceaniovalibus guishaninsula JLT2003]
MAWRLSGKAEEDLIAIWLQGARAFGANQADRYQDSFEMAFALLAEFPELARERTELTPPIWVHPCGVHLIVYLVRPDADIFVVRVRHSREDWTSDPT